MAHRPSVVKVDCPAGCGTQITLPIKLTNTGTVTYDGDTAYADFTVEAPELNILMSRHLLTHHPEEAALMDFGEALQQLKAGEKVSRAGWNGAGQFLELQVPDEHSKMTLPYIFITTVQGQRVPWLASQTDMLAEDWLVHPV